MKVAVVGFWGDVQRYASQLLMFDGCVDDPTSMRTCSIVWPIERNSELEKQIIYNASHSRWHQVAVDLNEMIERMQDLQPAVTHVALASCWLQSALPDLKHLLKLPVIAMADSVRQFLMLRFNCMDVRRIGVVGFLASNRILGLDSDESFTNQLARHFPLAIGGKDWFELTSLLGKDLSPKRIRTRNLRKLRSFAKEQKISTLILADIGAERYFLGLSKKEYRALSYRVERRRELYQKLEHNSLWPHRSNSSERVVLVSAEQVHIDAIRQLCLDCIEESD